MTPELAPLEVVFLAHSQRTGRPWPPDRFLCAVARGAFVQALTRSEVRRAEAAIDNLMRLRARLPEKALKEYEEARREAGAVLDTIDRWLLVAHELAIVADAARVESPFCPDLAASEDAEEDAPAWVLDGDGWISLRGTSEDDDTREE